MAHVLEVLWQEVGPKDSWYKLLQDLILGWHPSTDFECDVESVRSRLLLHAERGSDWLYNPCNRVLFDPDEDQQPDLSAQLLAWAAINDPEGPWVFRLNSPVEIWTPGGVDSLHLGYHSPASLCSHFEGVHQILAPWLDLWSFCVSRTYSPSWATKAPFDESAAGILKLELAKLFETLDLLNSFLPAAASWVRHATRIVVPCISQGDGRVRSVSRREHLGVVFMDITSVLETLETLVHESAHQHFFLYELGGSLVPKGEQSLFFSPLRKTMRPLRGVFLAYHALVYIHAIYSSLLQSSAGSKFRGVERIVGGIRDDLDQASKSMDAGKDHLTKAGVDLLEKLQEFQSLMASCE